MMDESTPRTPEMRQRRTAYQPGATPQVEHENTGRTLKAFRKTFVGKALRCSFRALDVL